MPSPNRPIAYLSLEIGLEPQIPTYSGGLGILAGDTIRAAADMGLPFVAVTLLYRDGYFTQSFDEHARQLEAPTAWRPEELLEEMPQRGYVPIEGRTVQVRGFRYWVTGATGHRVPVYFLDTDLPENEPQDRAITHALYAGDHNHRIKQAAVLAIAGRRMLRAYTHDCARFHLNEGHGFLLTVELMSEFLSRHDLTQITPEAIHYVREQCVFTTHTPIKAGHDRFDIDRVRAIVGDHPLFHRPDLYGPKGTLHTTILALNLSRYANGVARRHAEVSREMFPGYPIEAVTNGVHPVSWTGPHMARLLDQEIPTWRRYPADLRNAVGISTESIRDAHRAAKQSLLAHRAFNELRIDSDAFVITFARRSTAYKRPELILRDPQRLRALGERWGPIHLIFAGKAHPHDGHGKDVLEQIAGVAGSFDGPVRLSLVANYDIELARLLVAGSDLWLNNPTPPLEASGTSGMKAALNGVPMLSTLDGWWLEGWIEGVTGWAIEGEAEAPERLGELHAQALHEKLERSILPVFRERPDKWGEIMRSAIAINGSYFTTHRMVGEYANRAYME